MTKAELYAKMLNAMEGLDVSLKMGKESELVIKGDFMKIMAAIGALEQAASENNDAVRQIEDLKRKVLG